MKINGLQKMTLLDFPGKVACTVFFGGCDMRCPFCHNAELIDGKAPPSLETEDFFAFLKKRSGVLEGVAVTGGEPLLQKDLPDFLKRIRELDYPVKLDTNGTHPERLAALVRDGLVQYVAMDIKNSPERYAETSGVRETDLGPIRESVSFLMNGTTDFEFRTTAVAEFHDDESFAEIGRWIRGEEKYFIQKFTDRDTVPFAGLHSPTEAQMRKWAELVRPMVPNVQLRGVE